MGDVAAGNDQSPSGHRWRSTISPERGGFFGRTPVKGAPQGGELAELARPEEPYPAGAAASLLCILLHLVQPEIGDAVPAVLFQHCIKGSNRLYG